MEKSVSDSHRDAAGAEMTAQLVTDALVMAIWRRGKLDPLLHHSDRGSQYTTNLEQLPREDPAITVVGIVDSPSTLLETAPNALFSPR